MSHMNHDEAVMETNELNGPMWGGYSHPADRKTLNAWISHWRHVYDTNELDILREMATGEFNRFSGIISRNRPSGVHYSKAGLFDTEGEMAVADYMRLRAVGVTHLA